MWEGINLAQGPTEHHSTEKKFPFSDELLSRIVETIADGVILIDRDGRIVFANAMAERILGRSRDDIIGRTYDDQVWQAMKLTGERFPQTEHSFTRVMQTGQPVFDVEQIIEHPDGSHVIVSINSAPLVDDDGCFSGAVTSFRDITEATIEEAARRRSDERYRRLIDMAPDVIYSISGSDGVITNLNPAFEQITGWTTQEWIGKPFESIVHPDDLPLAVEKVLQVMQGEIPPPFELRILSRTGEYMIGEFRSTPQTEDGQVIGKFGIARDITERKRWEAEVYRRSEEFRVLADNVPDIIARFDRDLRHLYVNRAIERITGRPSSEFIGKTNAEIGMSAELTERWNSRLLEVFETGEERAIEFDFATTDGVRHFQSRLVPEHSADGTVVSVLGICRDITQYEQSEERLRFLAEASALLSSSLDLEETMSNLTRLIVPRLADCCGIDVVAEDGSISRLALAHCDPAKQTLVHEMRRRYPPDEQPTYPISVVIRTGEPIFVPTIDAAMIEETARDEDHLVMLKQLMPISLIVVPMTTRGITFGALNLVIESSRQPYTAEDLKLAEELAARAAQAIDNARLYQLSQQTEEQARQQAGRLQALAEASRVFAEVTLEFDTALETIARHVAERMGGLCIIRLVSADGEWLEPAAIHHPDPEAIAIISELVAASPQRVDEGVLGQVMKTGKPYQRTAADTDEVSRVIKPEFWPFHERFGLHNIMVVPLWARGRLIGTLGVFRNALEQKIGDNDQQFLQDLADRAALTVDNARLYMQTQEAVHMREEFISIASHELKTPLTTIRGYNQMLLRQLERPEPNNSRIASLAKQLWEQTSRLEALVTDLLDSSRIQQGRLSMRPEPFNLVDLASEILDRFEQAPERTSLHLLTIQAPEPIVGNWDRSRIDQVLTNLISNALKYSPEGGEVTVTVTRTDEQAEIAVRDEGIGIPLEDQENLFQPFARGTTPNRDVSGTGLGLYISEQIVERHGGSISFTSKPGRGSTFTVKLPLEPQLPTG